MKCNKIEMLLFLKKYNIINDMSYFSSLTDSKTTEETLLKFIDIKNIENITSIKGKVKKEIKNIKNKTLLSNLEYMLFTIIYMIFLIDILNCNIITLKAVTITTLMTTCFLLSGIKIWKLDIKNKTHNLKSELNIINYIENRISKNY